MVIYIIDTTSFIVNVNLIKGQGYTSNMISAKTDLLHTTNNQQRAFIKYLFLQFL